MSPSEPGPGPSHTYERCPISPGQCWRSLQTPVRFLKGVGPNRASLLETMGLKTVEDLLYHLPFRYEDRRGIKKIGQAAVGEEGSFIGTLAGLTKRHIRGGRRQILTARLHDGTGELGLVWFYPKPYIVNRLRDGQDFLVHGKVDQGRGREIRIIHPEFEAVEVGEPGERERILPVYWKPGGIPMGMLRRWIPEAMTRFRDALPSFLPKAVAQRQRLTDLKRALAEIHHPARDTDLFSLNEFRSQAHRSIIFDEFFYLQLGLELQRRHRTAEVGLSFPPGEGPLSSHMRDLLPFQLTGAQLRVLQEIQRDMEAPRPMQRLVQGDVGSGKTIVAWFAALKAVENGFQAALMAPTELLADQHYNHLKIFAEKLGISCALLVGSLPSAEKRRLTERIAEAEVSFVVGTHALIQESVSIPRLGLGIVDEQHRFGVVQRAALKRLAGWRSDSSLLLPPPDILLMTATPIPRSLAMVLYGDMDVSSLDEMPPGRTPIRTRLFNEGERAGVYDIVRSEVRQGNQAYVVYPLVEESERLPLKDATGMAAEFAQGIFKEFGVGLVHGRMAPEERDRIMRRFKDGELQILVATTVIEVGIDVPRATVMVVEHAERFGLSQLHQLRGRVGRGSDPSQCLLVLYGSQSPDSLRRLRAMETLRDGFKIAEVDLRLRGPGE
ncbi:MAG TPA: ATP-dependent DNA helicase RecG, partial [Candidatus Binatia bacterium]